METETEDWCFLCKEGGDLLLCDNSNCPKVYHSECLENEGHSPSEIQQTWSCDCHSCTICKGTSEVNCLCCPNSFCIKCLQLVKFAPLRHNKGLCRDCWSLVRLADEFPSSHINYKRKSVDFKDRDTYECLFKEYWEIVKEKQGLTRADLVAAKSFLDDKKQKKRPRPTGIVQDLPSSSSAENDSDEHHKIVKKVKNFNTLSFPGWASKPLIQFLTSIGVDATQRLSPYDVSSIIFKYIRESDLIHPIKQKKFMCDQKLHSIFRKKTVSIKQIGDLLKSHFSDNKTCFQFEPTGNTAEAKTERKGLNVEKKSPEGKGYYASVVADNIRLVYLRRSLVEDLLEHPESFQDKVVGSFVKVTNTDSRECSNGKISQQLLQVIGVKEVSNSDEIKGRNVLLHVCTLADIQISMLSDSDLTEEDCGILRENIANGMLQRPTVEEIEKKARVLHQDIMKRWIERELIMLQNRIDHANEKGRRSELYQLIEKREKLKKQAEQERLLKQLPTVIAADLLEEPMPASADSLSRRIGVGFEPSGNTAETKERNVLNIEKKSSDGKGYYASVVADNIRLVYLRRSLVEDLLEQPESFQDKVVGSFIKVTNTDSRECSKGKNSQQLLQVIGVKEVSSADEIKGRNVLLHVCTLADIQISMLSDSDLTEEDCENLRENIGNGLLQRPTAEEIEKKARILHRDIMKRWIAKELIILQNRIDHANEKGRRNELYQLIEQREKLKKQAEQERLLKQLPTVITADLLEQPMPTSYQH